MALHRRNKATKQITFRVSEVFHARLRAEAQRHDVPMSEWVRHCVEEFMDDAKIPAPSREPSESRVNMGVTNYEEQWGIGEERVGLDENGEPEL